MREVAAAAMPIVPTFDGIKADLERGLNGPLRDAGKKGGKDFGDSAGDSMRSSLSQHAKKAALLAAGAVAATGAVAGAGFAKYLGEAIDRGAVEDRLAAALGASPQIAERYGQVASNLYAGAWGESFDEVAHGVEAVGSSFRSLRTADDLERVSAQALNFAGIFEVDVVDAVGKASTVMKSGLADNATEAFDLITAASQRVPSALREDLLDAADEYGQFFNALGFSGDEAFGVLVKGSRKGVYGLDKAGDAIKEFTIRSTDGSKSTSLAFESIGLDAEKMANDLLAGGDTAKGAFDDILDGLLSIEDPATRAQTSLALFGTPLEDLGVNGIPKFLRSLRDGSQGLKDWEGSIDRAGDTLNDNAKTRFTSFKRSLEQNVIDFLGDKAVPVIERDVLPALERFGDWFGEKGAPAIETFIDDARPVAEEVLPAIGGAVDAIGGFLKTAAPLAKDLVGAFNDMPDWITDTAVLGALGLGVASKVKGGKGAAAGLLGGAKGSTAANPMYVWVVNGAGGPVGGPGKGGKPGVVPLSGASPFLAIAGGLVVTENAPKILGGLQTSNGPTNGASSDAILAALEKSDLSKLFGADELDALAAGLAREGENSQEFKDAVARLEATNDGAWEDINELIPVVGSWITTSGDQAAWALRDLKKIADDTADAARLDRLQREQLADLLSGGVPSGAGQPTVTQADTFYKIPDAKLKLLFDPETEKTRKGVRELLGDVDGLTRDDFRLIFKALGLSKARDDAKELLGYMRDLTGLDPSGSGGGYGPGFVGPVPSGTRRSAGRPAPAGLHIDSLTVNSMNANRLIADLQDLQRRTAIGGFR